MNKIAVASKTLMAIFYVYLLWIPFSYIYSWVVFKYPTNSPFGVTFGTIMHSKNNIDVPNLFSMQAPMVWKLAYSFETLITAILYMVMTTCLIRLFKNYSKQVIFDIQCVRLIKQTGIYLLLINVAHLLYPAINTLILSMSLKHTMHAFYFSTVEAEQLVVSLFIIVISWIMKESKKIHEEQQLTV